MGRIARRALLCGGLAAAAGGYGAALTGCGLARGLGTIVRGPLHLSVLVIGFVGNDGQPFIQALRSAGKRYAAAHRGPVSLDIATTAVPPDSWYTPCVPFRCVPDNTGQTGTLNVLTETQPAATTAAGAPIAVKGRTALDLRFGGNLDSPPRPAARIPSPPDIIIAYDVWAFWLGLFAADVSGFWKQASADRQGIAASTSRHGEIYCPGRGTVFAALPLLRSPMGLFCSLSVARPVMDPVTAGSSWTWDALTRAMRAAAFGIGTGAFSVNTVDGPFDVGQRVIAAEAAASVISAHGAALATTTGTRAAPALTTPGALKALEAFVAFRSAGHLRASANPFFSPWIAPAYLWAPLGGGRRSIYVDNPKNWFGASNVGGVFYPWPAGPSRRAVPASYLCAYLWRGGPHLSQAGDFCTFLLSEGAQRELARAGGGFALRPADAITQLPYVGARVARPTDAVNGAHDVTLADLYGGWKTDQNAGAVNRIADNFEAVLGAVNAALPAPANLPALVRSRSGM